MFKKTLVAIAIAGVLSSVAACSTIQKIADYGADANDELVKDSKFVLCKGASIGAILREFDTRDKAEGWLKICLDANDAPPLMLEAVDNGN